MFSSGLTKKQKNQHISIEEPCDPLDLSGSITTNEFNGSTTISAMQHGLDVAEGLDSSLTNEVQSEDKDNALLLDDAKEAEKLEGNFDCALSYICYKSFSIDCRKAQDNKRIFWTIFATSMLFIVLGSIGLKFGSPELKVASTLSLFVSSTVALYQITKLASDHLNRNEIAYEPFFAQRETDGVKDKDSLFDEPTMKEGKLNGHNESINSLDLSFNENIEMADLNNRWVPGSFAQPLLQHLPKMKQNISQKKEKIYTLQSEPQFPQSNPSTVVEVYAENAASCSPMIF